MSTIKSSAEHLTLNADGSGNDIKFQSNGSEVASISDGGVVTATSFAGSGANLTGVVVAGISSSADATAITIDSNEQVGIGVSSLSAPLQIRKRLSSVGQSTPETVLLLETDAGTGDMAVGNGTRILFKIADDETNPSVGASIDAVRADGDDSISSTDLVFSTSQNDETLDEALRIDSAGRILIGTSSTGSVNPNGMHIRATSNGGYAAQVVHTSATGDGHGILVDIPNYTGSGGQFMMRFYTNGGETGSIKSTQSSTAYNTSSDYRLKENVDYTWDATTRLKQLKPCRFNFIADDTNTLVDGFIAHEVQDIVPEAISGAKDAMTTNENGDAIIEPQGIDQSKLVPLLVKTIQELEARITALEA